MEEGTLELHGTLWGFFMFGFSYHNLYFKSNNESEKEMLVMENSDKLSGYFCPKCQITGFRIGLDGVNKLTDL